MSKDPGFLFYPGDYLRDTQNLSEKSQVAYDRIMCEHMRNICVSHQQVNFFTKRLNEEEKAELLFLLTETKEGFYIEWVLESITKRKAYSASRSKNRSPKPEKKDKNISPTYDLHMENEDVNENEIENEDMVKEGLETIRNLTDESKQVFEALQEKFGITELGNFKIFSELHSFVPILQSRNQIPQFIEQAKAYWLYKEKSGDKTHSPLKFIGTIEKHYQDGGWCAENWIHKLNNYKDNGKGKQITGLHGEAEADYIARKTAEVFGDQGN